MAYMEENRITHEILVRNPKEETTWNVQEQVEDCIGIDMKEKGMGRELDSSG